MCRGSIPGRIAWLLSLLAFGAPGPAQARSDVPVPADLLDSRAFPGLQGILELRGRNVHNVGNIWLHVTNFGMIGSQPGTTRPWSGAPSCQWPAGSTTEYLWSAGLWVGAKKNGEPHVTTGQYEIEFRPGLGELDRIYQAREGMPGGHQCPSPTADDDLDGEFDEDWLDGRDNDGDGRIDEDFAAISSQMFACEYGDTDPHIELAYPEHTPLGLLVRQSSMAWEDLQASNFIAFDFRLINVGFEPIEQVYVGFFADPDIGPRQQMSGAFDDMAGFWQGSVEPPIGTIRKNVDVSLGYMWDEDGDDGKAEGYVGLMFLGAEPGGSGRAQPLATRNFRWFAGKTAFEQGGDPNNDAERYSVLDGTAPLSLPPGGTRPPRLTRESNDYRIVMSAGPFGSIGPGDTLAFQAALVIGRGLEDLKENAAQAQILIGGAWADCDHDPTTGVDGLESPRCGPEFARQWFPVRGPGSSDKRVVPCDSTCRDPWNRFQPRCYLQVPDSGCIWIDADCDRSTGVDGNELPVRWLGALPPPSPILRLVARENEVDLIFDDRSEIIPDPRLQVLDFESYRIWRADRWGRPIGSDVHTGPGADLWMLVAEYDVRNGVGADTGLDAIRYTPAIPNRVVEFYREWFARHGLLNPPALPGFTPSQLDTAQALARGRRYYRYVDPPFSAAPRADDPPCGPDGTCPPVPTPRGLIFRRCDARGRCRPTVSPPKTGAHYFYSVTATDHKLRLVNGIPVAVGAGMQGDPQSNFQFIDPPSNPLQPAQYDQAAQEIYVVPNPVTRRSLAPWSLQPNNDDPSGTKIEFRHLPATTGKITIFTLGGDMVQEVPYDARNGNGSATWNLVSRNGQDVTSGVYLYSVEANDGRFERFVGKFVVVR